MIFWNGRQMQHGVQWRYPLSLASRPVLGGRRMQAKTIFYIYIYNVEAYTKNEHSTNRLPGMDWTLLSDIMLKKTWNHELPDLFRKEISFY